MINYLQHTEHIFNEGVRRQNSMLAMNKRYASNGGGIAKVQKRSDSSSMYASRETHL
jgi:hypothetical protein